MKKPILISMVLLLVVSCCSCAQTKSITKLGPSPEVIGYDASEEFSGLDYVITVKCQIRNNGKSGNIKVVAELRNGAYWKKEKTVFIEGSQSKTVEIDFPEAQLLKQGLSGYHYQVWAEPL